MSLEKSFISYNFDQKTTKIISTWNNISTVPKGFWVSYALVSHQQENTIAKCKQRLKHQESKLLYKSYRNEQECV